MPIATLPALLLLACLGDPCSSELPGNMPDLDQVRRAAQSVDGSPVLGLDEDGYGYCAPATTIDVFVYLANNGYPGLPPGPGGYLGGGNPLYNTFRNYLWSAGIGMSTDPTSGTNGAPWNDYLASVIDNAGLSGSIITAGIYTTSNSAPTLADIKACLDLGWPVIAACGWYEPVRGQYVRNSGHVFVPRRVTDFCTPGQHKLGIRDPATDNNLDADDDGHPDGDPFRQSQPSTETYLTNPNTQTFVLGNTDYTGPLEYMSGYTYDGLTPGTRAYIDSLRIFIPVFGLSPCCSDLGVGVTQPNPSGGAPVFTSFMLPPGRPIIDVVPSARRHRFFAIVDRTTTAPPAPPRTLWEIDRSTGAAAQVPTPVSLERICTGRDDSVLYALGEDCLIYTTIGTQFGPPITPPAPVMAITFDHARNELVAFSPTAHRVFRFNAANMTLVSNQLLPSSLPLGSVPRVTICPVGAYLWLASGLNRIDGLSGSGAVLTTAATISLSGPALGVDADDRGHVFTSLNGAIREFAPPTASGGPWLPVTGSAAKWAVMPAPNGVFNIARNVTNFSVGLHDQVAWTRARLPKVANPPSVPDCPPDVNNSGTLTVQDIFDFLMFYFSNDNRADFNNSGTISVQDIFDFLAAYFTGC